MKKHLSFILLLSSVLLTLILAHLSQRHKAPLGKNFNQTKHKVHLGERDSIKGSRPYLGQIITK